MSAHTAGPWFFFKAPAFDNGFQIESDDGYRVAMIPNVSGSPENEANARVIAAAPLMLSALQSLLDRYVGLVVSGDAGNWDAEVEPEVIAARAAISAATGQTP